MARKSKKSTIKTDEVECKLVYYADGATEGEVPQPVTGEYGDIVVLADQGTLKCEGHKFVGWVRTLGVRNDAEYVDHVYPAGSEITLDSETVYMYATWQPSVRLVYDTLNAAGICQGDVPPTEYEHEVGDIVTIPDTSNVVAMMAQCGNENNTTAYPKLVGWNIRNDIAVVETANDDEEFDVAAGDKIQITGENPILQAYWLPPVVTISYNLNGGEGTVPASVEVAQYRITQLPTVDGLTKTGYYCDGWTTVDGEIVYLPGENYSAIEDTVMYAHWCEDTAVEVTYDLGVMCSSSMHTPKGHQGRNGDCIRIAKPHALTLSDNGQYKFGGWRDAETKRIYKIGDFVTLRKSLHLEARWIPLSGGITVQYIDIEKDIHVPDVKPRDTQIYLEGEYIIVANYQPAKVGRRFTGWAHNGEIYQPGQIYVCQSTDDNIVFLAVWEDIDKKRMVFDLDGGSYTGELELESMEAYAGDTIRLPDPTAIISKDGYHPVQWSIHDPVADVTHTHGFGTHWVFPRIGDYTEITAVLEWADKSTDCTVTYICENQDVGHAPKDPVTYHAGDYIPLAPPGDLYKEGYIFAGWEDISTGHVFPIPSTEVLVELAMNEEYKDKLASVMPHLTCTGKDLNFKAAWTKSCTVTYGTLGAAEGTLPVPPQTAICDMPFELAPLTNMLDDNGNAAFAWHDISTGVQYPPGSIITIDSATSNLDLLPVWKQYEEHTTAYASAHVNRERIKIKYAGNDSAYKGKLPEDTNEYEPGDIALVLKGAGLQSSAGTKLGYWMICKKNSDEVLIRFRPGGRIVIPQPGTNAYDAIVDDNTITLVAQYRNKFRLSFWDKEGKFLPPANDGSDPDVGTEYVYPDYVGHMMAIRVPQARKGVEGSRESWTFPLTTGEGEDAITVVGWETETDESNAIISTVLTIGEWAIIIVAVSLIPKLWSWVRSAIRWGKNLIWGRTPILELGAPESEAYWKYRQPTIETGLPEEYYVLPDAAMVAERPCYRAVGWEEVPSGRHREWAYGRPYTRPQVPDFLGRMRIGFWEVIKTWIPQARGYLPQDYLQIGDDIYKGGFAHQYGEYSKHFRIVWEPKIKVVWDFVGNSREMFAQDYNMPSYIQQCLGNSRIVDTFPGDVIPAPQVGKDIANDARFFSWMEDRPEYANYRLKADYWIAKYVNEAGLIDPNQQPWTISATIPIQPDIIKILATQDTDFLPKDVGMYAHWNEPRLLTVPHPSECRYFRKDAEVEAFVMKLSLRWSGATKFIYNYKMESGGTIVDTLYEDPYPCYPGAVGGLTPALLTAAAGMPALPNFKTPLLDENLKITMWYTGRYKLAESTYIELKNMGCENVRLENLAGETFLPNTSVYPPRFEITLIYTEKKEEITDGVKHTYTCTYFDRAKELAKSGERVTRVERVSAWTRFWNKVKTKTSKFFHTYGMCILSVIGSLAALAGITYAGYRYYQHNQVINQNNVVEEVQKNNYVNLDNEEWAPLYKECESVDDATIVQNKADISNNIVEEHKLIYPEKSLAEQIKENPPMIDSRTSIIKMLEQSEQSANFLRLSNSADQPVESMVQNHKIDVDAVAAMAEHSTVKHNVIQFQQEVPFPQVSHPQPEPQIFVEEVMPSLSEQLINDPMDDVIKANELLVKSEQMVSANDVTLINDKAVETEIISNPVTAEFRPSVEDVSASIVSDKLLTGSHGVIPETNEPIAVRQPADLQMTTNLQGEQYYAEIKDQRSWWQRHVNDIFAPPSTLETINVEGKEKVIPRNVLDYRTETGKIFEAGEKIPQGTDVVEKTRWLFRNSYNAKMPDGTNWSPMQDEIAKPIYDTMYIKEGEEPDIPSFTVKHDGHLYKVDEWYSHNPIPYNTGDEKGYVTSASPTIAKYLKQPNYPLEFEGFFKQID